MYKMKTHTQVHKLEHKTHANIALSHSVHANWEVVCAMFALSTQHVYYVFEHGFESISLKGLKSKGADLGTMKNKEHSA